MEYAIDGLIGYMVLASDYSDMEYLRDGLIVGGIWVSFGILYWWSQRRTRKWLKNRKLPI